MTPLTAGQAGTARADLADTNLNPTQSAAPTNVHVGLKFTNGVRCVPSALINALSVFGVPKVTNPVPSQRAQELEYDAGSQLVTNPGFETNVTGWSAQVGGSVSRDTALPFAGAGAAQYLTAGVSAGEGIGLTASVALPDLAGGLYQAGVWLRSTVQVTGQTLQVILQEKTVADGVVGATAASFVATAGYVFYPVQRTFAAGSGRASMFVTFVGTPGGASQSFNIDGAHIGRVVPGYTALFDTTLNPTVNEVGGRYELDLAFTANGLGQIFDPAVLYDALDGLYGSHSPTVAGGTQPSSVASDKDRLDRLNYQFTIS